MVASALSIGHRIRGLAVREIVVDYLERLSVFSTELDWFELPGPVRERAVWVLADTLAAIVAGSAEPELRAMARMLSASGTASLPGLGLARSADAAALINGTAGTFLEMDEGNRYSRGHPAVHVLPAALALAEEDGRAAGDFLAGLVVGYEVGSRMGAASTLRGPLHPHGTWGTIGAAAACARVAGLSVAQLREVINVGASMSIATSKKTMFEGGLVRNVYAGLANRNGLLAARLVGCGFTGESDGPGSLLGAIVSDRFDADGVVAGLGHDWHLLQNYFKLHSCCRYNHGTLDALDRLAARGELPAAADVVRVEVDTYGLAAELIEPAPRNTLAAKFSLPFAVATRLVNGGSALDSFTWSAVNDPAVRALAGRVRIREDAAMTARLPAERPARVTITDRAGRVVIAEVGVNRGDDADPYRSDELRGKFLGLCSRVWPLAHAEALLADTLALADVRPGPAAQHLFQAWLARLRQAPAVIPTTVLD